MRGRSDPQPCCQFPASPQAMFRTGNVGNGRASVFQTQQKFQLSIGSPPTLSLFAVDIPVFVDCLKRESLNGIVTPREIPKLVGRIPDRPVGREALCRFWVKEDIRLVRRLVASGKAILEREDRFGVRRSIPLSAHVAKSRPRQPLS